MLGFFGPTHLLVAACRGFIGLIQSCSFAQGLSIILAHCRQYLVELRNGDYNTLQNYSGQFILVPNSGLRFRVNPRVNTIGTHTRKDRGVLQVRFVPEGGRRASKNFLW